jgi:hypothetical protein
MPFPHAKLADPAYLVTKASHGLYNAASAATLTLTGSLPSVAFRCSVRLYTATGKTDCTGSVIVGSEPLAFTGAGKKTTTTLLTALPVVTTSNLNCMIEIIALNSGGAEIQVETSTAIDIKFRDEAEYYSQAIGGFVKRPAQCVTDETTSQINDVIRFNGHDYPIKAIHPKKDRYFERRRVLQF